MKQKLVALVKNTFLTTGLSLSLLATIAFFMGGSCIYLQTVWQHLLANACVHITLGLLRHWESSYLLLDAAVDIIAGTLLVLGIAWIFDWFSSTPFYIIIPMVITIYSIGSAFQLFRVRQEINIINQKLEKRNANKTT